jgi:hypothetical protein
MRQIGQNRARKASTARQSKVCFGAISRQQRAIELGDFDRFRVTGWALPEHGAVERVYAHQVHTPHSRHPTLGRVLREVQGR